MTVIDGGCPPDVRADLGWRTQGDVLDAQAHRQGAADGLAAPLRLLGGRDGFEAGSVRELSDPVRHLNKTLSAGRSRVRWSSA